MKKLFYLFCFLFATAASAQYRSTGPEGGIANSFYRNAGRIWVASNTGIYYSDDNGGSWINPATPANVFDCQPLQCVAFNSRELYAGTMHAGIYHSTDGGVTWSTVNNSIKTVGANYTDVDISGPNAFAIRGDSGILMTTTTHGASWQNISFKINSARANWISVHNSDLYVSTVQGIYVSRDNGNSFSWINTVVNNGKLVWVGDTAYAATAAGILRSLDFAVSFTPVGLAGRNVQNVAAFGNRIFASVRSASLPDTIKYSNDGGASFSNALGLVSSRLLRNINDLVMISPAVIAATRNGLLYSQNGGTSWITRDSGFYSVNVSGLAVSGTNVYAATRTMGVFVSADSGTEWLHNGNTLQGVEPEILTVAASGMHVHAGGTTGYYHSGDNGLSWTAGAGGLPTGTVSSIYADGAGRVLAIQGGNVFLSANNGASFASAAGTGIPVATAYYVTGVDTMVFIGAAAGLYRATPGLPVFSLTTGITSRVTSVIRSGAVYYAATSSDGLHSSSDGITWTSVNIAAPEVLPAKINALAADNGFLYAGTDDGLYSNKSGGWNRDTLDGQIVHALAVRRGYVFAGTCGGVWSRAYPVVPPPVTGITHATVAASVTVYPNPSAGDFRVAIETPNGGSAAISLQDIMGHEIFRQQANLRQGRNDLRINNTGAQLPAGIYLLRVMTNGQPNTQRVVVR